ncbi:MAG TPA: aminotransferase class I/II-fold pyridoxal phosphate-dependent enzyme [Acidimicrobiales bacterium]|nr:aminotransferase class I/II-fold pyridoxal phosphate-dependent enzyme [Acidimicrobiales bacterium]
MTSERDRRQGTDPDTLGRHFGADTGLLPLWIAEPSVDLAPEIVDALSARALTGWYGYETRPDSILEAFQSWMSRRHGWDLSGLQILVSPSVGTSLGVLIEQMTEPGDGVILQPPVFTDFKPLIVAGGRAAVRNPLVFTDQRHRIDFDDLEAKASDPRNRMLILCSPHNPVGRVWSKSELERVASICAEHDVFVFADEIHADLAHAPHTFIPFALAAEPHDVAWAAPHGPIKTFGLAGVCDTLLITNSAAVAERFRTRSSQLHLTRNNVFGLAAFEAAYQHGAPWLDEFLALISANIDVLQQGLPAEIGLIAPEGTYLAWLDLRRLGLEVSAIPAWLASAAGLALSPGHWFGREGAGFARMTIAAPSEVIERAVIQLAAAVRH